MALLGNYSVLLKSPGRYFGGSTISDNRSNFNTNGSIKNIYFSSGSIDKISAVPNGYLGPYCWILPQKPGGMAIYGGYDSTKGSGNLTANLAGGINISSDLSGSGEISNASGDLLAFAVATLSGSGLFNSDIIGLLDATADLIGNGEIDASLSLLSSVIATINGSSSLDSNIVGALYADSTIEGVASLTAAINALVNISSDLSGSSSITPIINGIGIINSIIDGSSSLEGNINSLGNLTITLIGSSSLEGSSRADGYMSADITPFTELSPENLGAAAATAVWNAVAADFNTSLTMGSKMNSAGGAANPWDVVVEGSYTAADLLRLLASVAAGKTTITNNGDGTATVIFKDLADTTNRLSANMSGSERTNVTLDLE